VPCNHVTDEDVVVSVDVGSHRVLLARLLVGPYTGPLISSHSTRVTWQLGSSN
jgi:hypothetical protein